MNQKAKDCVGLVPLNHLPYPPEHQKPLTAVTTAKRSIIPKNENPIIKALLASQQVQIKRLRNVIIELQNEIENVKIENRTLKQTIERKAELANNLHRKLLLAEKKKSAAAVEEISVLVEKVRNTKTPADSAMKEVRKIKQDNTKEKDFGREVEKAKTDKGTQSCLKPLATFKTDTDTYKKTDEGKIITLSSSKPWSTIKTGTKTQEKPKDTRKRTLPDAKSGESPSTQNQRKTENKQLNRNEKQKHEVEKEMCVKEDKKGNPPEAVKSKCLTEDQLLAEMNANTNEKQMVQSFVTGDSIPAAGVKAPQNQSSTSSKGYLKMEVETKTVRMTKHEEKSYSFLEKLFGPRRVSAGDNRNILDDFDTPLTSLRSRRNS
ncbi:uncharacterized protein LOC130539271 isoform X2 [Takifugu flavidus]|uniref:uncharacterized protein LOC130539271 isoform X2 n=1 Tax=Takifugu flavidus TaxID=433684 RepID=UPI002544C727|nr:uncharacterized protein LOC130539271 isoform X2 [Takifugu flavidus]